MHNWIKFFISGAALSSLCPALSASLYPSVLNSPSHMPASNLYQLKSAHFTVIASAQNRYLGEQLLNYAEIMRPQVQTLTGYAPEHVVIELDNSEDVFNGFATPSPFPHIRLFNHFPSGYSMGSRWSNLWNMVLAHEYTHLGQLDAKNSDFQRSMFGVLGLAIPGISSTRISPAWFTEGLAVWVESRLQPEGGRLNNPYSLEVVRRMAAERAFPELSDASVYSTDSWPYGNLRYAFGAPFVAYLAQTYGDNSILQLLQVYGSSPIWQDFSASWQQVSGHRLETDWARFQQHIEASLADSPAAPSPLIPDYTGGGLLTPYWDGQHLVWFGKGALQLGRLDNGVWQKEQSIALARRPLALTWHNNQLYYSQITDTVQETGEIFSVQQGQSQQLTHGARTRYLSSDGKQLWYVREDGNQSGVYQLKANSTGSSSSELRWQAPLGSHILSLSASDRGLLVTLWTLGGEHQLLWLQASTSSTTGEDQISQLAAPVDVVDAVWSDDGRVIYNSGLSGVPLAYQLGASQPLANVGGGIYGAQVSAGTLVYQNLTAHGFVPVATPIQLDNLPLTPQAWQVPATQDQQLSQTWQVYQAQTRPFGWLPNSTQGLGATLYGGDSSQTQLWAINPYWNKGLGLSAQYIWRPNHAQEWQLGGSTQFGISGYFSQRWDTPWNMPLEGKLGVQLSPQLTLTPQASLTLGQLDYDDWGYPDADQALNVTIHSQYFSVSAAKVWDNQWLASAQGMVQYRPFWSSDAAFALSYHQSWPLKQRLGDGLVSIERVSVLAGAQVNSVGQRNFGLETSLLLDISMQYYLNASVGLNLAWENSNQWSVKLVSAFPRLL